MLNACLNPLYFGSLVPTLLRKALALAAES